MKKLLSIVLASVLTALVGSTFLPGTADADPGHVVTIDDVSVAEGSGGVPSIATVSLHVEPAPAAGERVKVDWGTSAQAAQGATAKSTAPGDITPTFPEDFVQSDGTVTFEALQTDQTIDVPVHGDNADEADETFYVLAFNARGECVVPGTCETGATVGDNKAVVTVTDDDATPTLLITDETHDEGDVDATAFSFAVTKTGGSGKDVTVAYATQDDSATAPADYTPKSGVLTFEASDSLLPHVQQIVVDAKGDGDFEPTEAFKVVLSDATNASISDATGTGTITNDDAAPLPSMTVADASDDEGGTVDHVVTLSSPPGPGQTATVDWALVPATGDSGVAAEGVDYAAASGSAVFSAGETEQTVSAATMQDVVDELDEGFVLELTKPVTSATGGYAYNLVDDTGAGTIADDDAAPTFSVDDVGVLVEGEGDTTAAVFTVTKTGATDRATTVHYTTSDGTAAAGSDYTASSGELEFAAGDVAKQVSVAVNGDTVDEVDETFTLDLSAPTNATIADDQGLGTITDDDEATASFAIGDVSITEGNSGTTSANFTVTKTGVSGQTTSVAYETVAGTAHSGSDYTTKSGSVSFSPVETSKVISIPIHGDVLDELNESFAVTLSNPTAASVTDAHGAGTIVDNDAAPKIAVGNDSEIESSSKACTLLVKLSAASGRSVSFKYATANGTAGTADYVAKSETMTFVPGDNAMQIKVFNRSDSKDERNETFFVKLFAINPSDAASFADATGVCTIVDND